MKVFFLVLACAAATAAAQPIKLVGTSVPPLPIPAGLPPTPTLFRWHRRPPNRGRSRADTAKGAPLPLLSPRSPTRRSADAFANFVYKSGGGFAGVGAEAFTKWAARHGKNYTTAAELRARFLAYQDNARRVALMNEADEARRPFLNTCV